MEAFSNLLNMATMFVLECDTLDELVCVGLSYGEVLRAVEITATY